MLITSTTRSNHARCIMNKSPSEIRLIPHSVPERQEPALVKMKVRRRRGPLTRCKRPSPTYVFGLCRIGLFLIAVAHVLLVTAKILTLVTSWEKVGEICALSGYLLLCIVVLSKVARMVTAKSASRKLSKPAGRGRSPVTVLQTDSKSVVEDRA